MANRNNPYHPDAAWPAMRGDTRNTGRASDLHHKPDPAKKSDVMHYRTGNGVFSTPVIDQHDNIYVGSADHNFYAINPFEQKEMWRVETDEIIDSAACVDKSGNVYIPSGDSKLHACDEEGSRKWEFDVLNNRPGGLFSASTNYWWEANAVMGPDGAIYAANDDFFVYCLEPDGKMRWAFRTGLHIWAAAAFGEDGTVYIPSFDMNLYAIDHVTGKQIWKKDLGNALVASPAIGDDGTIYQGSFDGSLHAIDPSNGNVKWSVITGGHIYASAAIAPDGAIYVGSTDGLLYAIDSAFGRVKWTFFAGDAIRSSAAVGPDPEGKAPYLVYFGGGDGSIYALDPEGRRRWSYDTLVRSHNTEYPNINASVALGKTGLATASANGDVIWIPYDYHLRDDAVGINTDPTDGFEESGASLYYVTTGGLINRTPLPKSDSAKDRPVIQPGQTIALRAIVREKGRTAVASILESSVRVEARPGLSFRTALQTDGCTINIIPEELMESGGEYDLNVSADYLIEGGPRGSVSGVFSFKTPEAIGGARLVDGSRRFRITHMSIHQPAIVPSLDQIGIASLNIPFSVVESVESTGTFVAWGVQVFGLTEEGRAVGVPQDRKLFYAFGGKYRDNFFSMEARDCFFEMTGFPVPMNLLRFSGEMDEDGSVKKGASLLAEYRMMGFRKAVPKILAGSYKGIGKAARWLGGKAREAGWDQFREAVSVAVPTFRSMWENKYWRPWGLFGLDGRFVGVGTFRMERIAPDEKHDATNEKIVTFEFDRTFRHIVADIIYSGGGDGPRPVPGILLADKRTGGPVVLDYNLAMETTELSDSVSRTVLKIPLSVSLSGGGYRAYLMSGLRSIATLDI